MFWIATAIFVAAYVVIVSEKINKTKVALFGASLTLATKVLTQHDAFGLRRGASRHARKDGPV